eukprot:jgi/Chrzof1/10444/UNPLg00371.t1
MAVLLSAAVLAIHAAPIVKVAAPFTKVNVAGSNTKVTKTSGPTVIRANVTAVGTVFQSGRKMLGSVVVVAPGTKAIVDGSNTKVTAPGTTVTKGPSGIIVAAPYVGTVFKSGRKMLDSEAVVAPGTRVNVDGSNTKVTAPLGTDVTTGASGTIVTAPYVGTVYQSGRKMLDSEAVVAPGTRVNVDGSNTKVTAPLKTDVSTGSSGTTVTAPYVGTVFQSGRKMLGSVVVVAPGTKVIVAGSNTKVTAPGTTVTKGSSGTIVTAPYVGTVFKSGRK